MPDKHFPERIQQLFIKVPHLVVMECHGIAAVKQAVVEERIPLFGKDIADDFEQRLS
ncbi:hypothetical protein D3C86_2121320 [compost metagenome]